MIPDEETLDDRGMTSRGAIFNREFDRIGSEVVRGETESVINADEIAMFQSHNKMTGHTERDNTSENHHVTYPQDGSMILHVQSKVQNQR